MARCRPTTGWSLSVPGRLGWPAWRSRWSGARRPWSLIVFPGRLERAQALGAAAVVNTLTDDPDERIEAFTAGQGADVVIEAVGAPETIEAGLRWFGPAGRYVLLGLYDGTVELPTFTAMRFGLRLTASRLNRGRFPECLEYLRTHPHITSLVTHRIALADLQDTLTLLTRRELEACKVMVELP